MNRRTVLGSALIGAAASAAGAASAKPAAWYLWASLLDGRLICQQVSPGPGWKVQRGPYRDARCQQAGRP